MAQETLVGQSLLYIEASRLHSDTPQSVGLLWTTDQLDAETSTRTTYNMTDRHPCPPSGIRAHNPSQRAAEDPRLRPRGRWGGQIPTVFSKTPRNMRKCNYCVHNVFRHHILKNVNLSAFDNKSVSKTF